MIDGVYATFNRGEVGERAFAREDVAKIRNAGAFIENFLPERLGPMSTRPGVEVLAETLTGSKFFKFVYSSDEAALIELGDSTMRIWIDDALVSRTAVTSTLTNGDFSSGLTGWTDASGSGASVTSSSGAVFDGADTEDAILHQTLGSTQAGAEHGLRVVVEQAPIRILIGTSGAESDDIFDGILGVGTHSLVFTPDAAVTITFVHNQKYTAKVVSCELEAAGVMSVPTDVPLASVDDVQIDASAGRIFCTWTGKQFVIERRGPKSWSVSDFIAHDGPFDIVNLDEALTISSSGLDGDVTLTASKRHFKSNDVGTLRRLVSSGQTVNASVTAEDNGTGSVLITGVENSRQFSYSVTGTFVATWYIQRSLDEVSWEDADGPNTTAKSGTFNDELDNADYYYRIYVKSGDFTSGTVGMNITYGGGGKSGIALISGYTSATSASAKIITSLGSTEATKNWYAGQWGGDNGYPNSVKFYEGRLWQGGKSGLWASVSDSYFSYDRDLTGTERSIYRSIGSGPVDSVNWIGEAVRLSLGLAHDTMSIRSSSFGEALTQDNISIRQGALTGADTVHPQGVDNALFFAQRNGRKVCQMGYDGASDSHFVTDLTTYHPDICLGGIAEFTMLREQERRLVVRLDNGELRINLFDFAEEVQGWSRFKIEDGDIKRTLAMPADEEDRLYMVVEYGGTEYLCKMAKLSESTKYPVDMFKHEAGSVSSVSGLTWLDGETVAAWSNGVKIGDFVVSSNSVTLNDTYTGVTVGKTITSSYQSAKLGQYQDRSSMSDQKRIARVGLYIRDLWRQGFEFGAEAARLDKLPKVYKGKELDDTALLDVYDTQPLEFEGHWDVDSRVYIKSTGPATILGLAYDFDQPRPREAS